MPRKRKTHAELDIESLARGYTTACIATLGGYATNVETDPDIRVRSINMLLDRGWGKPPSTTKHTGAEGGDIRVVIRQIIEAKKHDD